MQSHSCDEDIQKEPHLTEGAGHGRVYTYEGVIAISREVGVISRRNKWDHEVHTLFSPFPIQFIFLFLLGIQVRKYIKTSTFSSKGKVRLGNKMISGRVLLLAPDSLLLVISPGLISSSYLSHPSAGTTGTHHCTGLRQALGLQLRLASNCLHLLESITIWFQFLFCVDRLCGF